VCEKSDGIRYLLYLTIDPNGHEAHFFIDRKNEYWLVTADHLHLPRPGDELSFHQNTLLDGELVVDIDEATGKREPRYLVFDCLAMDGMNLMQRELNKRLGYFQEQIYKPYKALFAKYPEEKEYQPFILQMKQMEMAYGIEMMFRQVIKNLKHGNDGLIFTCLWSHYKPGTDPHILKWKSAGENTVDFRWKLHFAEVQPDEQDISEGFTEPYLDYDAVPRVEILAYHGGNGPDSYRPFGELILLEPEWEELKSLNEPLDERVVEAYMDEQKRWRFYRFRDDKAHGNHVSVVNSVMESIKDAVTEQELLAAAKSIRDNWKKRETEKREKGKV
jgi:mRNA guanylyltransferase